jgi:hypothetical protein
MELKIIRKFFGCQDLGHDRLLGSWLEAIGLVFNSYWFCKSMEKQREYSYSDGLS